MPRDVRETADQAAHRFGQAFFAGRRAGFLAGAGLEDCLRFLEDFAFTADDPDYLRRVQGYSEESVCAFAGLRFTGDDGARGTRGVRR